MEASAGGGGISVVPDVLAAAAGRVRAVAVDGRDALGSGTGNACITTGCPELDAALGAFDGRWSTLVTQATDGGERLASAVETAAASYAGVDACVIPGATP